MSWDFNALGVAFVTSILTIIVARWADHRARKDPRTADQQIASVEHLWGRIVVLEGDKSKCMEALNSLQRQFDVLQRELDAVRIVVQMRAADSEVLAPPRSSDSSGSKKLFRDPDER